MILLKIVEKKLKENLELYFFLKFMLYDFLIDSFFEEIFDKYGLSHKINKYIFVHKISPLLLIFD